MPDEKKTYLIDIKSNLQEYIDLLVKARKALEDERIAQEKNTQGKFQSREQIAKNQATIRQLQKDVSNATKMVDLATQANKAEVGSYEQLYKQWQLAQVQMKLVGGAYMTLTNGQKALNPEFFKQNQNVINAKKALDAYGKTVHDNRLNCGSYSEALQGMAGKFAMLPGPLGNVASRLQGILSTFGKTGPIVLGIGAALTALASPFVAFYKSSQQGMDILAQKTAGLRAEFDVLKGSLIGVGKEASKTKIWEDLGTIVHGAWYKIKETILGPDLAMQMEIANISAQQYTKNLQDLEKEEIALIVPRAKAILQIRDARLLYADTTKSFGERYEALKKAIDQENYQADQEEERQKRVRDNAIINYNRLKAANMDTRAEQRKIAEADAEILNLQSDSAGRLVRASKQLATARKEMLAETLKILEAYMNETELVAADSNAQLKAEKDKNKVILESELADNKLNFQERENLRKHFIEIDNNYDKVMLENQKDALKSKLDYDLEQQNATIITDTKVQETIDKNKENLIRKYWMDIEKLDADEALKLLTQHYTEDERERKRIKDDLAARFEIRKVQNADEQKSPFAKLDTEIQILEDEHTAQVKSVEYLASSDAQKALIEAQYTAKHNALTRSRINIIIEEADKLGSALSSMQSQLGQNTMAYKTLSIAIALIDVFKAAANAMASWTNMTVVGKIAAVATILAEGMSLVNAMRAIDVSGSAASQAANPITSSPATKRILAPTVGANILTPTPQERQTININQQNQLTAADIAKAIAALPAPVVTVEDINAKIKEVSKVSVRATV